MRADVLLALLAVALAAPSVSPSKALAQDARGCGDFSSQPEAQHCVWDQCGGNVHRPAARTANGLTPSRLTIREASWAARREVYRVARKRDESVEQFRIKWCRRRSALRVGCRYTMFISLGVHALSCHGGARVTERARNTHSVRAWRDCSEDAD
jgi:hypothetical protein